MSNELKITVLTSDNRLWLLRGLAHQFNKYDPGRIPRMVEIAGFSPPPFELPGNFTFHSIGKFEDYPIYRWSNAVMRYLESIDSDHILILLEDYWMMREMDWDAVWFAQWMMEKNPEVVRFDLSSDRLYSNPIEDKFSFKHYDIFEAWSDDYCLSFQAGIWNRKRLLDLMVPGENPWQAELNGSARLAKLRMDSSGSVYKVLGFRQWPLRYQIVVNKGKLDKSGAWMVPHRHLTANDWKTMEELGYDTP